MEKYREKFSLRSRIASFRPAIAGMRYVLRNEHNAWIQQVVALIAVVLGILLDIRKTDWLVVILCIGLVLAFEAMNTAVEKLVDLVSPGKNEQAKLIKDVAAGAVLISAIASLAAGLLVFLPYLIATGKQLIQ